ncbi:MAG: hypothetical protein HWE15_07585 [Algoriphagus sp.]|uniref:hypothetical protein n=1 Tax=Algoriphagus sp. TaxID=1872435 RepID=UPI0017FFFB77|nr:hypothetical protein [Algoriphagus sp.]NVJ86152.1 hypothetical protein [Algoriphagus sp.]
MADLSLPPSTIISKNRIALASLLFLFLYWLFGFDGITFSDDVYYLLAGRDFWNGEMEVNDYHFSSRWGAYIPAGLLINLFGMNPQLASLSSLLYILSSYLLIISLITDRKESWIFSLWFITPVYFLHFITKVYPDTLLVLCVSLVAWASVRRKKQGISSGILMSLAFFIGMVTKETMVLLALFPLILFFMDLKRKDLNQNFYFSLILTGIILLSAYLGYFWLKFGDPLYRIQSINAGHYISEFTYADKGWARIVQRITYLPILTFIERAYWPWIVFALPGIVAGLQDSRRGLQEFSLAFLCLLLGFWFMTSTLEVYNPIYLNPRHLIILIPLLSFLIGSSWKLWVASLFWKRLLTFLLIFGAIVSIYQGDLKMSFFHFGFVLVIWIKASFWKQALLVILLIVPAIYVIQYQKQLKEYPLLVQKLNEEAKNTSNQTPILTNNFLVFSREIVLADQKEAQNRLTPIEEIEVLKQTNPKHLKVFIYRYYHHAYPKEEEDVEKIETWLKENYRKVEEMDLGQIWIRKFEKK